MKLALSVLALIVLVAAAPTTRPAADLKMFVRQIPRDVVPKIKKDDKPTKENLILLNDYLDSSRGTPIYYGVSIKRIIKVESDETTSHVLAEFNEQTISASSVKWIIDLGMTTFDVPRSKLSEITKAFEQKKVLTLRADIDGGNANFVRIRKSSSDRGEWHIKINFSIKSVAVDGL